MDKWYDLLRDIEKQGIEPGALKLNNFYPYDGEYDYYTWLEKIDLDKEKEKDLKNGNGFEIGEYKNIKKALKDNNGIFSSKFGQTLQDLNTFIERYKCKCKEGGLMGTIYDGVLCEKCGERVKYVGDNFDMFAWFTLNDEYPIIHPNMYKTIEGFIGEGKLDKIIQPSEIIDQDGKETGSMKKSKNSDIYDGIGMIDFVKKFDEIIEYYKKKFPNKKDYYNIIIEHRSLVFTHSIPVFTTLLRPFKLDDDKFYYNNTNDIYVLMNKLVDQINNNKLRIFRKKKSKNLLLFELQEQYNKLYKELEETCSGKKGSVRTLFGGRYNFTARDVIVQNINLKLDEVTLSYYACVELLQQSIVNILVKTYNMQYYEACIFVYKAGLEYNEMVFNIIKEIISSYPRGIPVIINRNPTIVYGGILQSFIVDITLDYTLSVPLEILGLIRGDFDGDNLNIMYIINEEYSKYAYETFNPALNMVVDRNDGYLNMAVMPFKDNIINIQTFLDLSRVAYTQNMIDNIKRMQSMI